MLSVPVQVICLVCPVIVWLAVRKILARLKQKPAIAQSIMDGILRDCCQCLSVHQVLVLLTALADIALGWEDEWPEWLRVLFALLNRFLTLAVILAWSAINVTRYS